MNVLKLVIRSLRHYLAPNFWVAAGMAISTAVLTGGLIVGDSVKYSLEQSALLRLGNITHSLTSGERYFTTSLAKQMEEEGMACSVALKLEGILSAEGGQFRLNRVNVWGIDDHFSSVVNPGFPQFSFPGNDSSGFQGEPVFISENIAVRMNLKAGDNLLLRIGKASLIPANAPFVSDRDQVVSFYVRVKGILTDHEMGRLNLRNSQTAPFNVFIPVEALNRRMALEGKANVLLIASNEKVTSIEESIREQFSFDDAGITIRESSLTDQWEILSERVFIDDATVRAVENTGLEFEPVLTYFVNRFQSGRYETPYSFISSLPDERLGPREIIINRWLAGDLNAGVHDSVLLEYYEIGPLRELTAMEETFVISEIVPLEGYFSDRSLMPMIPGLSDADNCRDWQTGVPVNLKAIRDKDEDYWYQYRGLPKAFVAYSTAQELWANRYGSATSLRFNRSELSKEELELALREQLDPFAFDLMLRPARDEGLTAARNGTDFSQLFLGLSFFILISGVMLTALLFRLNLAKRTSEIGTLSSLGFSNRQIQLLFLREGLLIALFGAISGSLLAVAYNQLVFWGLGRVWNDIVRTTVLIPDIRLSTLFIGATISMVVGMATLFFSIRLTLKRETAALQRNLKTAMPATTRRVFTGIAGILSAAGILLIFSELLKTSGNLNSGLFFIAGGLFLIAFLTFGFLFLSREKERGLLTFTMLQLIGQNLRLNRSRSMIVMILLSIGTFLVISTGLNRKDLFSGADNPKSGTGGFLLWAESTLPVLHNLNNPDFRKEQGFTESFHTVQMHSSEGDDASCLNLNRISTPRILGVEPALLDGRFSIQTKSESVDPNHFWETLNDTGNAGVIPAIADQTVIQWGFGKKVGDTLFVQNELGASLGLKLVGGLAASVFQGSVIISEQAFLKNFPSSGGTNVFLVDGKEEEREAIARELTFAFRDHGFELSQTANRLAEFKSVENTYLTIFLVLGALGLLIGTVGLAVVLQRSLLERKAEMALLIATGYPLRTVFFMLFSEYLFLLLAGIIIGFISALLAVFPALVSTIENIPLGFIAGIVMVIVLNGIVWIYLLAKIQLKNLKLIETLRNE